MRICLFLVVLGLVTGCWQKNSTGKPPNAPSKEAPNELSPKQIPFRNGVAPQEGAEQNNKMKSNQNESLAHLYPTKSNPLLSELIYQASVKAFQNWRLKNPTERVFAFALSTLDEATYVDANVNTLESHQRLLTKKNLDPNSEYGLSAKWVPCEWENEYICREHFTTIHNHLRKMYENDGKKDFGNFRQMVFDSMLEALIKLRKNRDITNDGDADGIVLFSTIYDSFSDETMIRRSAKLLNSPNKISELISVFCR